MSPDKGCFVGQNFMDESCIIIIYLYTLTLLLILLVIDIGSNTDSLKAMLRAGLEHVHFLIFKDDLGFYTAKAVRA